MNTKIPSSRFVDMVWTEPMYKGVDGMACKLSVYKPQQNVYPHSFYLHEDREVKNT